MKSKRKMKFKKKMKIQKKKRNLKKKNEKEKFSELKNVRTQSMSVSDNVSRRQCEHLVTVRVR